VVAVLAAETGKSSPCPHTHKTSKQYQPLVSNAYNPDQCRLGKPHSVSISVSRSIVAAHGSDRDGRREPGRSRVSLVRIGCCWRGIGLVRIGCWRRISLCHMLYRWRCIRDWCWLVVYWGLRHLDVLDRWLCHLDALDRWRRISLCHLDMLDWRWLMVLHWGWCSIRHWGRLVILHWSLHCMDGWRWCSVRDWCWLVVLLRHLDVLDRWLMVLHWGWCSVRHWGRLVVHWSLLHCADSRRWRSVRHWGRLMVLHWGLHCVNGWCCISLCHMLYRWRRISLCHLDVLDRWLMVLHWSGHCLNSWSSISWCGSIGSVTAVGRDWRAVRGVSGEHTDRHGVTIKLER